MTESQGSVLDILIYVFDRYMLTDTAAVPEREELALDLERQGFSLDRVEQALDWLADLAGERDRPQFARWAGSSDATGADWVDVAPAGVAIERIAPDGVAAPDEERHASLLGANADAVSADGAAQPTPSLRVFTSSELQRLPAHCRGYLYTLERAGILSPRHRELVIERLLALEPHVQEPEIDVQQLKWVVLMVLSSQPGEELACSRMEGLVFDEPERLH